jgi:ubiquinone/menaquinone biosynthesis C-methylase UbiE
MPQNLKEIYDERALEVAYNPESAKENTSRKYLEIIKYLNFSKNTNVIEVGCGNGPYIAYLSKKNTHSLIVGADISIKILHETRKRLMYEGNSELVDLVACQMEYLPFKPRSFDNILNTQVIEHLLDDRQGLKELSRIIKADGLLIISTDNKINYFSRFFDFPFKIIKNCFKIKKTIWKYPHYDYTPKEFSHKVGEFFKIISISTFRCSLPYPLNHWLLLVSFVDCIEKILIKIPRLSQYGDIVIIKAIK